MVSQLVQKGEKVKTRKRKAVFIELTRENHERLEKVAKKTGLKWEQVVDMILACEVDIIEYSAHKRKKLAEQLKIRPTKSFLYKPRFLG